MTANIQTFFSTVCSNVSHRNKMLTRKQKAPLNATCQVVVEKMDSHRQIRFAENVEKISPELRGRSRARGRGRGRGGRGRAGKSVSSRASKSRDMEIVAVSSSETEIDEPRRRHASRSPHYRYDDYGYRRSRRDRIDYDAYGYHHRSYVPNHYRHREPSPYRYRSHRYGSYSWSSPSPSPPPSSTRYHRYRHSPSPQSYRPTKSRATKRQADDTPKSAKRVKAVESPIHQRSRSVGHVISPKPAIVNRRGRKSSVDDTPKVPAKRSRRAISIAACACSHHTASLEMPKSPLLPKTAQFQVSAKGKGGPIPNLLAINPPNSQPANSSSTQKPVDQDLLNAQIKINTEMMAEVQKLRTERKELLAVFEQAMKEKEMVRAQLKRTTDQLDAIKQKMDKRAPNNGSNAPASDGPSQQ